MALPAVIEPCLPSPDKRLPTGSGWVHEIKHDGYRLMARRDPVGIRLITRRGNDWTPRVTDRYRLAIAILIVSSGAIGLPLPDKWALRRIHVEACRMRRVVGRE